MAFYNRCSTNTYMYIHTKYKHADTFTETLAE